MTAVQYAKHGIRVNTVVPGQMHTPMVEARLAKQRSGGDIEALLQSRVARIPLGFMGDGRDTANAVLFSPPTNAFITQRNRGRWRHDRALRLIIPGLECPMAIRADDLTPTIAPPDPHPKKPRFKPPPLACDSHFHVFGPHGKFPYAANQPFTPSDASKEELFRLHEFLGFERGVFVQSTCHGSDHAALVDLLAAGQGRYRGVALLEPWTPQAEVDRLDDAGVRGVRLHFYFPHLGAPMRRDDMLGWSRRWRRTAGISPCISAVTAYSTTTISSPRSRRRW